MFIWDKVGIQYNTISNINEICQNSLDKYEKNRDWK